MKHEWRQHENGDCICDRCHGLRVGSNDDEDCPAMAKAAEVVRAQERVDTPGLEVLIGELQAAISTQVAPGESDLGGLQHQLNELRAVVLRLAIAVKP